ncbi:MAG TPA: hypothetical protein VFH90_07345 [Candidatus Limnocylindria bacterium]|nr:hypothetical protein [Candidatus Limnocylindria bacterium]
MRRLVAGMVAGLALTLGAGSAVALCGAMPSPAQSLAAGELAFVGTVGSVSNSDRWATFQVREVWHATDLPRFVEVRGSAGGDDFFGIFTSVSSNDRFFAEGVTYLVFPHEEGDALYDNDCSATEEWSDRLADLRPASAHPPSPSLAESAGGVLWTVAAGVLASLALGPALLWTHRQRPGGEPPPA